MYNFIKRVKYQCYQVSPECHSRVGIFSSMFWDELSRYSVWISVRNSVTLQLTSDFDEVDQDSVPLETYDCRIPFNTFHPATDFEILKRGNKD